MSDEFGLYFAPSYKGKQTCIDSGLNAIMRKAMGKQWNPETEAALNEELASFLKDYEQVWYKDRGELRLVEKLTASVVKVTYPGRKPEYTLTVTPHYKVPNELQSLGRPALFLN